MIKKILFMACLLFLLSGCSINYNLKINDDASISETTNLTEILATTRTVDNWATISRIEIYYSRTYNDYSISDTNNKSPFIASGKAHFNDINDYNINSVVIKELKLNTNIYEEDSIIHLNIDIPSNLADQIDELHSYIKPEKITIKINSLLKVIDNNANKVVRNNYIWNIKSNNPAMTIHLNYIKNERFDSFYIFGLIGIKYGIIIALGVILLLVLITIVVLSFIKNKGNKSNKI